MIQMLKKAATFLLRSTRSSTGTRRLTDSAVRTDVGLLMVAAALQKVHIRSVRARGLARGKARIGALGVKVPF